MPRNRHLPGWRFLRFITIVTVYDPICNVIRIGLTSLPGGVANRLPLLRRRCQITGFSFVSLVCRRGSGAFCPAAKRRRVPQALVLPRPAAAEKEGSPSPIPPQSRKIARNRTTLGRNREEISRITADTARFSGKRRKSPGRPARRFLFALCLIGSGVFPQYTTSSFPGAKARSAARQMRSVQPSTPKRAVLRVMS